MSDKEDGITQYKW